MTAGLNPSINLFPILASLLGGGLAGGAVSIIYNRITRLRSLRTQLHPYLNGLCAAYAMRLEYPNGGWLVTKVGYRPLPTDVEFVERRSEFIAKLVDFNELKEARELRRLLIRNINPEGQEEGNTVQTDLSPEYKALRKSLMTLQKKLGLS